MKLFFLPPYSPELKPDELVWSDVNNDTIGCAKFEGPQHLHLAVVGRPIFLRMRPGRIRSFFGSVEKRVGYAVT